MADQTNGVNGVDAQTNGVKGTAKPDYDSIVVGAGFAGLRIIHDLQNLKHNFKVIEAGSNVGGTWYWNRYPGARTDSESWVYIMNFSKELNDDWKWRERFPRQPEVLEYLDHVCDRFDMRKHIQFNTRVSAAKWNEDTKLWTLTTKNGESWTCRYFISAAGFLSLGRDLPFPGVDKFKGETYRTFAWPKDEVSLKNKRVAIVGTGATAVQVIPMAAHQAKHVTVFQRTPNWVIPARNHPLTDEQQQDIKDRYAEVWAAARTQMFGMDWVDSKDKMSDEPDEAQIKRILEYGWEIGGFRFLFETFADLLTDQKANDTAAEFLRDKIRSMVKDQETAKLLSPDHAVMAKRPPLGHHYFETFNKSHVQLISVAENPIKEITEKGITLEKKDARTKEDEYEFDVIIYAIGFDASTGPLSAIDVRGVDNKSLGALWKEQLQTFLAVTVTGFPNLFMISGPQCPFANFPVLIDNNADWIGKLIGYMEKNKMERVEPKQEAMDEYGKRLTDVYEMTVLPEAAKKAGSWYVGANVPGKRVAPLFWFGGVASYFTICDEEQDKGYPGLTFG